MANTYIRASNPVWFMVDLVGLPLNDQYYMFVLSNVFPYLPQPIYTDYQGTNLWSDPIQFLADGTLPVDMYWDSALTYRLEIRKGQTQADPLVRVVENYAPGGEDGGDTTASLAGITGNMITNPQFVDILFKSPLSISAAGTYAVAPGWYLQLTGSGTATVTQVVSNSDANQINNPPYALEITTNGWTGAILYQRFSGNGALWASTDSQQGIVSMSVTAQGLNGSYPLTLKYFSQPSTNGALTIVSDSATGGAYSVVAGSLALPNSADGGNSSPSSSSYVDMQIVLQTSGTVFISNVQVTGQSISPDASLPAPIPYIQQTVERDIDNEFHYYLPQLSAKPQPSYLVGWDFPLNPTQFTGPTVAASAIGANKSKYVWDQTIVFQSADSGVGVTRGAAGELVLTAAATTQMAIVQYLDAVQARKILNAPIAVNVSGKASVAKLGTVSLWYTTGATLPVVTAGTNNSLIATLDANGKPATFNLAGGVTWTEVPRRSNESAQFIMGTSADTNFNDYGLNGWDMNGIAACNTATFFAIVVGFASVGAAGTVSINSVGLCPGDIATRPAPQTFDEVLRECQFYYEKSYPQGSYAGDVTALGSRFQNAPFAVAGTDAVLDRKSFSLVYNTKKRTIPTTTFYSPAAATADRVLYQINRTGTGIVVSAADDTSVGTANYTLEGSCSKSIIMTATSAGQIAAYTPGGSDMRPLEGRMLYQFASDARLGIV